MHPNQTKQTNMKKVIIAAALILGAGALHAQTATTPATAPTATPQARPMRSPQDMAKMQTDRLSSIVKLSDDQSKSIYQANLDWATKMQAARQANDRNGFKQATDDRDAQYKKILTADQYTTYNTQRGQMMPNRVGTPGARPAGAPATAPTPTPAN